MCDLAWMADIHSVVPNKLGLFLHLRCEGYIWSCRKPTSERLQRTLKDFEVFVSFRVRPNISKTDFCFLVHIHFNLWERSDVIPQKASTKVSLKLTHLGCFYRLLVTLSLMLTWVSLLLPFPSELRADNTDTHTSTRSKWMLETESQLLVLKYTYTQACIRTCKPMII